MLCCAVLCCAVLCCGVASQATQKSSDRDLLIHTGIMQPLLSLLSSPSEPIRTDSAALLMLLTTDAAPVEQAALCRGLEADGVKRFEQVIKMDIAYVPHTQLTHSLTHSLAHSHLPSRLRPALCCGLICWLVVDGWGL